MRPFTQRFEGPDLALRAWRPDAPGPRLLCLPYSGGSAPVFKPLAEALPGWSVAAVDPPGHGLEAQRPVVEDVEALAAVLLEHLPEAWVDGAFLLGWSLGGYVVHAMVRALEARPEGPRPAGVILCASPPYPRRSGRYSDLSDEALLEGLVKLGGIPRSLEGRVETFKTFAPVVRADFRAYENAAEPQRPIFAETLVVGGAQDPVCPPEHLDEWRAWAPRLRVRVVRGGHVFLGASTGALADHLEAFAAELG